MKPQIKKTDDKLERLAAADPFIEMSDDIDRTVSMLRVAWLALTNPRMQDEYGVEYVAAFLERVTDDLEGLGETSRQKAKQIWDEVNNG
jgi:hypothetical protein